MRPLRLPKRRTQIRSQTLKTDDGATTKTYIIHSRKKRSTKVPAIDKHRTLFPEIIGKFIEKAKISPVGAPKLFDHEEPGNYNDDLLLVSFRPIRYTWAGERRKGITMHIADAESIDGHIRREIEGDFYMEKETPIPGELSESIRFVNNSYPRAISLCWGLLAERVGNLVGDLTETQKIWDVGTPFCVSSATGKLKPVFLLALSLNFHLVGRNWINQFTYGPPS